MPVKRIQQSVPGATASDVQPPVPVVQPPLLPPPRPLARVPPAPPQRDAVEYPCEDGIALISSPEQGKVMLETQHALDIRFESRPDVYVGFDILVYDKEGDNTSCLAPDVFVTFDMRGPVERTYRIWAVGKPPDVIWEFASDSTWQEDAKEKKARYRQWGVAEYWLYDPQGGLHDPRLQGFQLVRGRYRRLPAERRGAGLLAVKSPLLGLEQHFDGQRLRLWDPVAKAYLRTNRENEKERRKERTGRLKERAGRLKAEAGEEREREGRLKAEAEQKRERERRLEADSRAEAEAQARREAEAREAAADNRAVAAEAREAALRARLAELEKSGAIPRK